MILHMSLSEAFVEILVEYPHRGPCVLLYRSLSEDLVEILVKSLHADLADACPRGACKTALLACSRELPVPRSFLMILWDSFRGRGMKILVEVLYTSHCDKLLWRS